ncbi:MAG: PleD family two-component system response regulator [Hyphomicrobium aestuarii]|nr:PleD family two-component system response regulator [Hyphomicrobium aestuarii]
MTARVLVVDDIIANVKLLGARLTAEYFDVLSASSGQQALDICARERVDVVLLDVMMPGMDGFEVCRRLKADPHTHHLPVIMVTALDQPSDRIQGLEAGADDFLTKPVDDIALVTRVKNLARLKMLTDEMAMRAVTSRQLGVSDDEALARVMGDEGGRIMVVDDHPRSSVRLVEALGKGYDTVAERDVTSALTRLAEDSFDVVLVSLSLMTADGLRLCSQIRSLESTRHLPIVIMVEPGDEARLMRGLDMGINDYVMRPIERHELLARVKTQAKRKRHSDFLRNRLEETVEQSITDSLTGLHNRRYLEGHLRTLVNQSMQQGRSLSVLIADIDHFKLVNDSFGHDVGDMVLREFSQRFRRNTRGIDLAGRLGGEEFVIIMPDTDIERASQVAERLRACVAADEFSVQGGKRIKVTASVGVATLERAEDTPDVLLKRADRALYAAKRAGRNRVEAEAA